MKNLIFTAGYFEADDELILAKGHRSDVLVEDEKGNYFELNFIDLNRLNVDFQRNKEFGKNFFTDLGLIVLDEITKDSILMAVRALIKEKYFLYQKPQDRIELDEWYKVRIG